MQITFLPVDLGKWDQTQGDVLVVFFWHDIRPLRGAAGLLDWRMNGKLSSWIKGGRLNGTGHEQTLIPTRKRLVWETALALGIGPSQEWSETRFREAVQRSLSALRGLKKKRVALALPGREQDVIGGRRAMELLLEETKGVEGIPDELVLIEPFPAQKEMLEVMRKRGMRQ